MAYLPELFDREVFLSKHSNITIDTIDKMKLMDFDVIFKKILDGYIEGSKKKGAKRNGSNRQ